MSAAQMLRHSSRFMDLYLGHIRLPAWVRVVSRTFGPLFLRSFLIKPLGETPRNMGTLPAIRPRHDLELDFEAEQVCFLDRLSEVEQMAGEVDHAMYGRMKAEDAQALVRHHTAHHFRQFGLI